MTLPVAHRRRVQHDLAAAYDWYEQQRCGLGEEFLLAVQAAFQRVGAYLWQVRPNADNDFGSRFRKEEPGGDVTSRGIGTLTTVQQSINMVICVRLLIYPTNS